ncbi:auxin efflux carrier family protein, putative [Medicago truncatula]|uniref:Auxin efflux carrier family protein, putative n=1 Tax=Medicago truncatula TaxID=3880 RepID=A0A072TM11_MEDTR|nr:auxin efflux carrier family protein, putative [Medicago truncatula]
MEFLKLFIVALMPVLKVLLITVLGTFLALDRFDILSRETARKNLNTMTPNLVACDTIGSCMCLK